MLLLFIFRTEHTNVQALQYLLQKIKSAVKHICNHFQILIFIRTKYRDKNVCITVL